MAETVLARMAVQIAANTAEFGKGLNQANAQLNKFTTGANNAAKGLVAGFGVFQIANIVGDAINSISEFEHEMSIVKSITGATGAEFDALKKSAIDLGGATKFTAKEVAELQTAYGRLGFSTGEILNVTKATLDLATATGEDLAKSADVVGSTLRAFGLDATETGRVVDVMAGSFNKSALGLENFSEAMKYVAPIAAQAGLSLEETTALLGTLADNGIRGSMAGTSLRKIISDLGGESGTLSEKLQKLADKGLTGADAMDEVGRTAYASLLILAKNTNKTNDLTKALGNVAGEAKKTADIVNDDLTGDIEKLGGAYDSAIQKGGVFGDSLREIVQAATNLVNAAASAGDSPIFKMLNALVSYTPNLYTLAKLINAISDDLELTQEEAAAAIIEAKKALDASTSREETVLYIKMIAELTSKFNLLNDKAVEFKDTVKEGSKAEPITIPDGIIEALEKEIKRLEEAQKKAFSTDAILGFETQIDALQEKLKSLTKSQLDIDYEALQKRLTAPKITVDIVAQIDTNSFITADKVIESTKNSAFGFGKVLSDSLQTSEFLGMATLVEGAYSRIGSAIANTAESLAFVGEAAKKAEFDIGGLVSNGIGSLAAALGEAAVGVGDLGETLLQAIAKFAVQFGEILIATGVGTQMLQSGNAYAMIVGGAILVAAGSALAAVSKQRQAIGTGSSAGSSARSSSGSSAFKSEPAGDQIILLGGEFKVRGNDLVLALDKANKSKQRTG